MRYVQDTVLNFKPVVFLIIFFSLFTFFLYVHFNAQIGIYNLRKIIFTTIALDLTVN